VSDPPEPAEGSPGGWWRRFADRLGTGRKAYVADLQELFGRPALDEQFFDDLEGTLLSADVGAATTERTLRRLREEAASAHLRSPTDALQYLKQAFLREMQRMDRALRIDGQPAVVLVVGVNGSGKTTTVAKLAHLLGQSGHRPLIAAADTYRAAAIDQLKLWGERAATPVIAHQPGSDPGAVAYDAIQAARARGSDVVLVDTAGRLHTRTDLMDELRKIQRVIQRQDPAAPQEVLAVLDAHIGQNSAQQVRRFGDAVQLTGLAVTKMDGSARAGVVLSIEEELQVPTKLVGIGEGLDDLNFFDPVRYLDALLGL
jgi:fused signal recognition particle receptor